MGIFDVLKKKSTLITVTPEECLEEIRFMLSGVSLCYNDAVLASVVTERINLSHNEELWNQYLMDMYVLQQKIVDLLVNSTNLAISDIIPTREVVTNCLHGMVTSAYYAGQYDAYNSHLNIYLQMLSTIPSISINAQSSISNDEKAKLALHYILTSTDIGREMMNFVNTLGNGEIEFLNYFFSSINNSLEAHKREKQLLFDSNENFKIVNNMFTESKFGKKLLDNGFTILFEEFSFDGFTMTFEEVSLLCCIYLIGRIRVDYNILEIFNEVM